MSAHIVFEMQFKPEAADGFAAAMPGLLVETRQFEGCERVNVLRDQADPTRFVLVEQWRSKADYEKYLAWRQSTGMMDQLQNTLAAAPVLRYFDFVA
ncbi:MAG: putative quinol monooxygenase [Gammaproteobacteria bacterium]